MLWYLWEILRHTCLSINVIINRKKNSFMNCFWFLIELFITFHMSHGKTRFRNVIYTGLSKWYFTYSFAPIKTKFLNGLSIQWIQGTHPFNLLNKIQSGTYYLFSIFVFNFCLHWNLLMFLFSLCFRQS